MADDRTDLAEDRTEWAEERTDWAEERTLLAKERTFAGWARTGLASGAAGVAAARLLGEVGEPWMPLALGSLLLVLAGAVYVIAFLSYRKALRALADKGIRGTSLWAIGAVTAGLALSSVLGLLMIFQ